LPYQETVASYVSVMLKRNVHVCI